MDEQLQLKLLYSSMIRATGSANYLPKSKARAILNQYGVPFQDTFQILEKLEKNGFIKSTRWGYVMK